MIIFVDIDNTICETKGEDYRGAIPVQKRIEKLNKLHEEGNTIVLWTARGSGSGVCWKGVTKEQLKKWNVKYHELRFKKPVFDIIIDDRAKAPTYLEE